MERSLPSALRISRNTLLALGLVTALLGLDACKPKVGGKCSPGKTACDDPNTGLVCEGGTFMAVSCKGPKGCLVQNKNFSCDNSVADVSDGCQEEDDAACSSDKGNMLKCRSKKFVAVRTCRGPDKCRLEGKDVIACDSSQVNPEDVCETDQFSCSTDLKTLYQCKASKLAAIEVCRGKGGCSHKHDKVKDKTIYSCDNNQAEAGDVCNEEGDIACSVKGDVFLKCSSGKFVVASTCRGLGGQNGCSFRAGDGGGTKFRCDSYFAQVGEPCNKLNDIACAMDKKSLLTCDGATYSFKRACKFKECTVVDATNLRCQ
jgi:hypothetical protein